MSRFRLRDTFMTLSTVWSRALLDAAVAPGRFRKIMPEFRRVSDMTFHRGVSHLEIGCLPNHTERIQMLSIDPTYGGMPPQDLYSLLRILLWLRPTRLFEIGTFEGVTTAHMALNTDADIYTLDLPRDMATSLKGYTEADAALLQSRETIGRVYRSLNCPGRIHQLFGDSRIFDYSAYYGTMDAVLVDACHLYDYVISDSNHAFRLIADRGVILWHDFGNSRDVVSAVCELGKQHQIFHIEGTWLALHMRGLSFAAAPKRQLLSSGQIA
jgi:predicted O-methyltransferase YrrM